MISNIFFIFIFYTFIAMDKFLYYNKSIKREKKNKNEKKKIERKEV